MRRHRVAAAAALLVVIAEWSGGGATGDPGSLAVARLTDRPLASETPVTAPAPPPRAAPPAPQPPPPRPASAAAVDLRPLPDVVDHVRPTLRIDAIDAAFPVDDMVDDVLARDGISEVVLVHTLELSAATATGLHPLRALAFDDHDFRRFTPDVTANEVGVWQRLQEGNIVLTQAAAHRVDAQLGEGITVAGSRASESLRVGALAENGVPQLADVLLPRDVADRLEVHLELTLLVVTSEGVRVDRVADDLVAALGGRPTVLSAPPTQQALRGGVGQRTLEPFSYQSIGDGTIRIDPPWVRRHIVSAEVPVLGRVMCHRLMIPQLAAALREIEQAGLAHLIEQFDGCWVPRHLLWDPNRGISRHAWGLAFDINAPTNGYGRTPQIDMRLVDIFRRWGFRWGGDFSIPDGMHFELERIIDM